MTPRQRGGQHPGALVVRNLLRSPPTPISFSGGDSIIPPAAAAASSSRTPQITPAGFVSLLLGVSLSLMLCGSLTFFIGFMLMPWVFGLVMVFYLAGIISTLSVIGRSFFGSAAVPRDYPPKKIPSWKLS